MNDNEIKSLMAKYKDEPEVKSILFGLSLMGSAERLLYLQANPDIVSGILPVSQSVQEPSTYKQVDWL